MSQSTPSSTHASACLGFSQRTFAIAVIKIGGSVFTGLPAYRQAAEFIRNRIDATPGERLVIVVSAQNGVTDHLEQLAKAIVPRPHAATLDLLWSTGELRSVALLALHLQALAIHAAALNVHQTGLVLPDGKRDVASIQLNALWLNQALARHPVAIVPGFLATRVTQAIVSLGRGGSDLTAVLLAAALRASRCELIKDVPGYFTADPRRHHDARLMPKLSFDQALRMAQEGCDLVQPQAIAAAARHSLPLVIQSLEDKAPKTCVGSTSLEPALREQIESATVVV